MRSAPTFLHARSRAFWHSPTRNTFASSASPERSLRVIQDRRVPAERTLPRALELALELGLAQTKAQPSRVTGHLAGALRREQRLELSECALLVPQGKADAREAQAHDRRGPGLERIAVAQGGRIEVTARVERRAI